MTELETQLSTALAELSGRYATELKQLAGQVESLGQQVQQLDAHVTALASDYRRIADALTELSRRSE